MKKITYPLILATAIAFAGCTNDDNDVIDKSGFAPIELGGISNSVMSRAGFTQAKTTLKVHYESTRKAYAEETFPYNDGLNADGTSKGTLYMTSTATAEIDGTGIAESVSAVTQTTGADGQKRYWDDIHGKNSILSLYAIAVPNKTDITNTTNKTAFNGWDTNIKEGQTASIPHTIAWTVSGEQTLAKIADEDLAYSNNIKGDGHTLGFDTEHSKFEKAEGTKTLDFNHALTRLTINVKKGDGFGDFSSTEFNVTKLDVESVGTAGELTVTDGTTNTTTTGNVNVVGTQTAYENSGHEKIGYTYVAQFFPGKSIFEVDAALLTIVVDGNNYTIKGSEVYTALLDKNVGKDEELKTLKAGTNYKLFITINKKGVAIESAKLVPWGEITAAEEIPSNAVNVYANMEQSAGTQTTIASDIYRSTALATGYVGNKNTLSAGNALGSNWYWPDNSTSYYFRTISPQNTTVTSATNDYITMEGGAIADGNDYIWGAPLAETHSEAPHTITYSNGYDTYLHAPIAVTESQIHITQFHMMSKIQVNLTTTDNTLGDAVTLTDATVEILNYDNSATLALSNAAITLSGSKTTTSGAMTTTDHLAHTWRVVPQPTSGITFKITANGNVYKVNLPSDTGISEWVPGKSYIYTFMLKKTGIEITSAKLVDWEEVKAAEKEITLES